MRSTCTIAAALATVLAAATFAAPAQAEEASARADVAPKGSVVVDDTADGAVTVGARAVVSEAHTP